VLVSYDTAVRHLKLPPEIAADAATTADLTMKLRQAEARVLAHVKIHLWDPVPVWDETTDPATDANFAIVQAAVLVVFGYLTADRGDTDPAEARVGPLNPAVVDLLSVVRDPSFA